MAGRIDPGEHRQGIALTERANEGRWVLDIAPGHQVIEQGEQGMIERDVGRGALAFGDARPGYQAEQQER